MSQRRLSLRARAAAVVTTVTAAALGAVVLPAHAETVTAVENDLDGDGRADLVVVGDQASLGAGLWLTDGSADGGLSGTATDIGVNGLGASGSGPADYNGRQAIVGHFRTGAGPNDVLIYDPATGAGAVLYGTGDGSPLNPLNAKGVSMDSFMSPVTRALPTSIANAGQLYITAAQGDPNPFPSLLSVLDGALWLQPTTAQSGGFFPPELVLADTNPTGSGTWSGWSITTALVDNMPALFARSDAGGQLYYYSPAALLDMTLGTPATPVLVASAGWDAAAKPLVQAADVDQDGTVDLRAVDASGNATTYRFDGTSLTALGTHNLLTGADTAPGGTPTPT
ncbi:FG-GAP repeat domain-containing protein, partial [Streptomyces sp. NRRL B-24484]|uniref:FG-GAP repeat domain-containing protein n=1 Tax=Streptomyces sp. NRRL B-24484 TaxID=1463833 RepID=UPI0005B9CE8E